jgi:DNA-binding LacI/PurR family transcriptional regulator
MASLKDVAKKAGVSNATVSRVLNNVPSVSPDIRARVNKAIRQLKYQPNRVARRLRSRGGQKKLIGLLIPDIQNPFYIDVVRGVEDIVYANNYAVYVCNFAQDEKKERLYIDIMKSESIDGLIVAPFSEHDEAVISLLKRGLPIVCVDRGLSDIDVDLIVVDNFQGAYDAVDLLIRNGHRRIAYVGGLYSIPTSRQREAGYRKALLDNSIELIPELIKFGDSKHESGKKLTAELLDLESPPTAIFTGNNLITLGALETIHARGLHIPNDVAIIGFDDMYWSISLNPPLTAVRQSGYEIGRRAASMLFERIEEPSREAVKVTLKTKLIIRSSCGTTYSKQRAIESTGVNG